MAARTRKKAPITSINMVSLLDIFTILLLFLLVQAGDPDEVLPVFDNLNLPFSEAQAPAKRTLVVAIDKNRILLEGRPVADISDVAASEENLIPGLADALRVYVEKADQGREAGEKFSGKVTIMGDRTVPFSILKKVMLTCASQHFGNVSLAVQQRETPADG
jgi:biopolymer transport protein ExbD